MAFFMAKPRTENIDQPVLALSGVSVQFLNHGKALHVVRDMGFRIDRGSRTVILGETGCGKSVMAMALFRLLPANAIVSGNVFLNGDTDVFSLTHGELREMRGGEMVLVPQNPMSHLNPVFSVGFHIKETLRRVNGLPKKRMGERSLELLEQVGFAEPPVVAALYPHQLSGGMAQRVMLAMSMAGLPSLVVADEPTRGLDAQSRDHYLALSRELYRDCAFLMITHDLAAARTCERVIIMYAGRIVEEGPVEKVLGQPGHPYTRGLIAAHPDNGFTTIPGMPPELTDEEHGCAFEPRCTGSSRSCCDPPPMKYLSGRHRVRCCHA
ncbi:MAG: ABC transporter ATP-binding protein [Desulfobacteraceae bacterium]|nr:ABC transporter ATP-binding protein [Desulfobacteraceae bacterium]